MRIALFFDRTREDTSGIYFERALQRLGIEVRHYWLREAHSLQEPFDLYLRIDHGDYVDDVPAHLHPSAWYVIDTHLPKSRAKMRRQAWHYDWVFCAQRNAVADFARSSWLPAAQDPEILAGDQAGSRSYDVGFVGTRGGVPRKLYLQAIRERYPRSLLGWASHTQIGEIYRASKIVFNYAIRNDINMRVFEALGAGSCLLTNAIRDNGFEELFRDREHLVVYHSPQELWALLDYYLTHDDEREAIARQGHALAQARHTYVHRAQAMLDVIHQRLGLGGEVESAATAPGDAGYGQAAP